MDLQGKGLGLQRRELAAKALTGQEKALLRLIFVINEGRGSSFEWGLCFQ